MNIFWKLAYNNLKRNQRRTLATAFTICIGYVGLMLMTGYIIQVEKAVRALTVYINHSGHISVYKKDAIDLFYSKPSKYLLTKEYADQIQKILEPKKNQIETVGFHLSGMGLLSNGQRSIGVVIDGVDPQLESFLLNHPSAKEIKPEFAKKNEEEDLIYQYQKDKNSISITSSVGELIGREEPFLNLPPEMRDVQLAGKNIYGDFNAMNVVLGARHLAVMAFANDTSVQAPIEVLQELMSTDGYSSMSIYLKNVTDISGVVYFLQSEIEKAGLPLEVYPFYNEKVGMFYVGTLSFLITMGIFIFILVLLAVALSVVNTITMGIIERTKEIGTLRAIGYKPEQVSKLFVIENIFIALFCILIGSVLAHFAAQFVNSLEIYFKPTGVAESIQFMVGSVWWAYPLVALPVVGLTALTAYVVSIRKTRTPINHLFTDAGAS